MSQIKQLAAEVQGEDIQSLKEVNVIDQTLTGLYLASSWVVGVVQNSIPAVADLWRYTHGQNLTREMPWKSDFPYDPVQSPAYEITNFIFVAATYGMIFTLVSF